MSTEININSYPTAGQLERDTSQKVRALYRSQFGHQPGRVDCHLLGNKIVISLEDVTTPIEKLLVENQSSNLVVQLRNFINEAIKPKLQELVEEIFQVDVTNCLYDTAIDTGYAGAIVVLASAPQIRKSRISLKRGK
ncbi:MAG: DUF2294 domain-containing protein [Cyanobacteria bacterium P01_G01_bin.19]